jgi:cytosine/adenosine deaminase-related metal-dependent hydrolase
VVDFHQPHLLPVGRWLPKLIYSANGGDVIHTIIDGQVVMKDRKVLTLDEDKVIQDAVEAHNDLVAIAGQETRDLMAAPWPEKGPYWRSIVKK